MYYTYVLKSLIKDYYYKGLCKDLNLRLNQHNNGLTKSIKPYIPFEIVYFEVFESEENAILREKYFKTAAGRRFLKQKLAL